jgi:hypothetical protein
MSDEWLNDHDAVVLIRKAREVSEAVAVKRLVEACAEGLVRTWQRGCWEPKGFGCRYLPLYGTTLISLTACF